MIYPLDLLPLLYCPVLLSSAGYQFMPLPQKLEQWCWPPVLLLTTPLPNQAL